MTVQNKSFLENATSHVSKLWKGYQKIREAAAISEHFSTYLAPQIAISEDLRTEVFKIRHNVYCEELAFEPVKESGLEMDDFDQFSVHCLIQHLSTHRNAGTVRMVIPRKKGQLLPLEKYCSHSIEHEEFAPHLLNRDEICEISRLAVPEQFRRRNTDNHDGAAVGVINEKTYSENELRCFPFIATGLYMSAASMAFGMGIKHAFVMMEPRLARSMRFIGIKFVKIGPTIEYHGQRAPYYISTEMLMTSLSPGFKAMLSDIQAVVNYQLAQNKILTPKN